MDIVREWNHLWARQPLKEPQRASAVWWFHVFHVFLPPDDFHQILLISVCSLSQSRCSSVCFCILKSCLLCSHSVLILPAFCWILRKFKHIENEHFTAAILQTCWDTFHLNALMSVSIKNCIWGRLTFWWTLEKLCVASELIHFLDVLDYLTNLAYIQTSWLTLRPVLMKRKLRHAPFSQRSHSNLCCLSASQWHLAEQVFRKRLNCSVTSHAWKVTPAEKHIALT